MVAWKDGEPEIKISFKREFTKEMQDTPKKATHPLYERLKPAPPLSAHGLLFLLAIIISAGALRDYSTIKDVLAARPPAGTKYRIMDWVDGMLDDAGVPEMSRMDRPRRPKRRPRGATSVQTGQKGLVLQELWGSLPPVAMRLSR